MDEFDFDQPTFAEVIAYLHGVADGTRAHRRATGCGQDLPRPTCATPRRNAVPHTDRRAMCEPVQFTPVRTTLTYAADDSTWARAAAYLSNAPWAAASAVVPSPAEASAKRNTLPFLSPSASVEPPAESLWPENRASGVCLRVQPLSSEWYQLTGTDDGGNDR